MPHDERSTRSADASPNARPLRVLYCRCAYADVVPEDVKDRVLQRLCESGRAFDTVADLCEMSARHDPALNRIAECGGVKIAACYKRAVHGLFEAAGAPLSTDDVHVLNMRTDDADTIADNLLNDGEVDT
ncbi:hypothetical protein HED60_15425 [Planctomycetales bacterium ZRK34]|nr:hypothetical protein HED60_15425 [Planctomycetales bacterium ZRK34]